MAASFTSQADLELRLGVERVRQLFDDDRDGVLGVDELATLAELAEEASQTVVSHLLNKAWGLEQMEGLSVDKTLRRAATQIFAQLAGERRPEFNTEDGSGVYDAMGERGRETLKAFGRGEQRSATESTVGVNKSIRGRHSPSNPVTIFGRDPGDANDKMGDDKGF